MLYARILLEFASATNASFDSSGSAMVIGTVVMALATVATAYYAYQQHKLDKNRVKIELYGRRLKVYNAMNDFIGEALATNQADSRRIARWYLANRYAGFLFPEDTHVTEYINQLYENREKQRSLESKIQSDRTPHAEVAQLLVQQEEVRKWFEDQSKRLNDRFRPYLQL